MNFWMPCVLVFKLKGYISFKILHKLTYRQMWRCRYQQVNMVFGYMTTLVLNQEEMAEQLFISVRRLARIESGEAGMDVWQFITILELLGSQPKIFGCFT